MIGQIGEFIREKEEWSQYWERLQCFFDANDIEEDEKKRAILLTVIGSATYKVLSNLTSPTKPKEKPLADLIALLKKHFEPTPSEIVQRYKFNTRCRQPSESIATFMSEVRAIAEHCNFGQTLDVMLRDRLVCGINDKVIQKRLLAEDKLTLAKAMEIAQAMEMAAENAATLNAGPEAKGGGTEVHTLRKD